MNANDLARLTAAALTTFDAQLIGVAQPNTAQRIAAMYEAIRTITTKGDSVTCAARQYGDEMKCACGLSWDVGDAAPPKCRRQRHVEPGHVPPRTAWALDLERRETARQPPAPGAVLVALPLELAEDVAREMAAAMIRTPSGAADPVAAMRSAYRILLDRLG